MHVSSLELKNFKRFTDLTIDLSKLAQPPKLVLLIGANGSGKSSVFDGFETLLTLKRGGGPDSPPSYHAKNPSTRYSVKMTPVGGRTLEFTIEDSGSIIHSEEVDQHFFYGRSSLRQVPRLTRTTLGQTQIADFREDRDRPYFYIDRDERFENDLEMITRDILHRIYKSDQEKKTILDFFIQPINKAFERIFAGQGNIVPKLLSIIPPLDGRVAEVQFQSGLSF